MAAPAARERIAGRPRARQFTSSETRLGWLFVAAAAIFIVVFLVLPLALAVAMAFIRIDLTRSVDWTFFGLGNFNQATKVDLVVPAALRTIQYAAIVVALTTTAALGFAVLLNERFRGVRVV